MRETTKIFARETSAWQIIKGVNYEVGKLNCRLLKMENKID